MKNIGPRGNARAVVVLLLLACLIAAGQWARSNPDIRLAAKNFLSRMSPKPEIRRSEIEATLVKVKLPEGFSISLYALARGARTLAVGHAGKAIFVGSDDSHAYVIERRPGGVASVETFAPTMGFRVPHGVCLSKEGALFIVERNKVTRFDDAENSWRDAAARAKVIVPEGELIPRSEESGNHSTRVCVVGPDDKLYISLGQPHNVAPQDKLALYAQTGVGGIIRMEQDGSRREVFATGVRNAVGMDFDDKGRLWFTDNQVDEMGDDIPPGEINRADRPGLNFGFPWFGGGHVRTREYALEMPPADAVFPQVEQVAHAADLGMIFYRGRMFPEEYRGGIFSAQHGSWDRSVPVGARVMFTKLGPAEEGGVTTAFAEGWNTGDGGYLGRPVSVAELEDGSLLVTDDQNDAIYRISYGK
jgi:glucose/arabinose dehydrogenase